MKLWLKQTMLALCIILITVSAALYWFTAVQTNRMLDQALANSQRQLSAFAEHLKALERTDPFSERDDPSVRIALIQYTFAVYARLLQTGETSYSLTHDGAYLYNIAAVKPLELLPMANDALSAYCTVLLNGAPQLILARQETIIGLPVTLYLAQNLSEVYTDIDQLARSAQAALLVCLALCGVLLPLVFRHSLRPLHTLNHMAQRISTGDYALRSSLRTADEVGDLSRSFDAMAATVEQKILSLEDTARRRELLLGALTHELKTPMTAIIGYAESLLTMPLSPATRADAAHEIYDAARRTERLSQKMTQLIALTDCPATALRPVDPAVLLATVEKAVTPLLQRGHVSLRLRCAAPALSGDSDLLFTLLTNLIDNAIKASPPGEEIILSADEAAGCVRLMVSDHGCGIPADQIDLVTEPFYRVDKARSRKMGGAGLGLALCSMIAQAHNAALVIDSQPGHGTSIHIDLALAERSDPS